MKAHRTGECIGRLKILFLVPSYKPAYIYGGTVVVTAKLAEQLVLLGHDVTVYTTTANGDTELDMESGKVLLVDGVKVRYFQRITKDHSHVSPALWRYLNRTVKDFDVVHIHSWWSALVVGAALICKTKGVKPVLSPHGMFSEYILNTNNAKKKMLLHSLYGKKLLENTFLHVSTRMELDEAKSLIPKWTGTVIPNLVDLPAKLPQRRINDVFTIGFLSRVDPKKGLNLLIEGLSEVPFPYRLVVGGSGDAKYVESLKRLARARGNADRIIWAGWQTAEQKFSFLAEVDLFALTSHSENFAAVVIEALSVGTPVLLSDQVGLKQYVMENDFGWVSPMAREYIVEMLIKIYKDESKRKRIADLAPAAIQRDFDPETLAGEYAEYYRNMSRRNNEPYLMSERLSVVNGN